VFAASPDDPTTIDVIGSRSLSYAVRRLDLTRLASLMEAVWDGEAFVSLLSKLVGEARHLQNGAACVAVEDRAARHVLDALQPYSVEAGGPLVVRHVTYAEGRGNVLVELPGVSREVGVSLVGMHLDVVPANPDTWSFDPFALSRSGDELRGRGVTDCLGHVALVAQLLVALAKAGYKPARSLRAVFIANEENSRLLGVGVDELLKRGELDALRSGPLLWVDVADVRPCIGTGGVAAWTLRASGKLGHSGLPQNTVNSLELVMEAVAELQRRFYARYPAHPQEAVYQFACGSTFKPTQAFGTGNSVNQVPGEATLAGDIRITPFYELSEVMASIEADVAELNSTLALPTRGPWSAYALPAEGLRGKLTLSWGEGTSRGVACNLASPGYAALKDAFIAVTGKCEPMAITGSLPCIRDLQDAGFDVQTVGFGLMKVYHANDEFGLLSDFKTGFKVLARVVSALL